MEKTINYREELEKAREAVKGLKRDGYGSTIDAYWEVCCGDVLVAEENLRKQSREWENSSLAKEFLDIATYLEGYDHMLERLYSAVSRMVDTIFERPRLKLKLLDFELMVLRRIEAQTGHDMSICEHVSKLIVTGATANKIKECVKNAKNTEKPEIFDADNLAHAVKKASEIAKSGDIVIMSPASASFDCFKNFMERGGVFKNLVMML